MSSLPPPTAPKSQQTPTREGNFSSNHRELDLTNLKIPLVWANGPLSKSREKMTNNTSLYQDTQM